MAEVLFYHLTESRLEEALPGLLKRSVQRGWKVVVQTGTEERRDALDTLLWTYRDESFLAHATDREPHQADQPILLTTGMANGNNAEIRFLVDGASPPDLTSYARAVFMFDGHDAMQLEGAREQWKAMKAAGHAVTYWQQTPDRRWERKV
ncbi:DNA polymerase III subunit chi [Mesorhizobium sp. L-8-10]|uniref:DNA polymerase III subunit chi n=1 Tax=Mesorhizobium sp. L-8-10 TaxID=2744523 RepID=UPI0019284B93|nr:DNA polymerase III subunit chi [Mesorhizobium sp. L-8-10]BCH33798.1 DNA polymerase III subunit chi [Mesorhizobium sp. L-8-10]